MIVSPATSSDLDAWAAMRAKLWPDGLLAEHREEARTLLRKTPRDAAVFIARDDDSAACAFVEASLRHDYVNGCDTSPVAFVEGIYVQSEWRDAGVGKQLAVAVESWARDRGCAEIASDALLDNVDSHAFHVAIGFEETERVVYFRKRF